MKYNLKILFATDFSGSSRISLDNLRQLKKKYKLDVYFMHVMCSFWKNWFASGLYQKEALQRLQAWEEELIGRSDPEKLFVEFGNRADTILSKAQALPIDLIVLGAKNTNERGRYKSGTTVEDVVRNAKNSVLVCKSKKISKIICGIDGSPSSEKALNWAIQLAKDFNAKLSILSVLSKIQVTEFGMEDTEILKIEEKIKKEKKVEIEQFLKKFDFKNLNVEKQFRWGIPSHVLLDTAEDFEYDMIVIGAKGHSMLHHVLMGSTAEKILRFSPCSLLVVR